MIYPILNNANAIDQIKNNNPSKYNAQENLNKQMHKKALDAEKERLKKFIELLEKELGKKAKVKKLKLQIGDIYKTHASISKLKSKIGFKPVYNISKGVSQFVKWFKTNYYS